MSQLPSSALLAFVWEGPPNLNQHNQPKNWMPFFPMATGHLRCLLMENEYVHQTRSGCCLNVQSCLQNGCACLSEPKDHTLIPCLHCSLQVVWFLFVFGSVHVYWWGREKPSCLLPYRMVVGQAGRPNEKVEGRPGKLFRQFWDSSGIDFPCTCAEVWPKMSRRAAAQWRNSRNWG